MANISKMSYCALKHDRIIGSALCFPKQPLFVWQDTLKEKAAEKASGEVICVIYSRRQASP